MSTNDPQAPYTVKLNGPIKAATAPMLSREYIEETFMVHHDSEPDGFAHGIGAINVAIHVRNFYEAKIASGELMVNPSPRNKLVVDGEYTHVYGAHSGLYLFTFKTDGTTEIRADLLPKLVGLPDDMFKAPE